jgi:hypothetical protein
MYFSDRGARSNWHDSPIEITERVAWRVVAGNNRPIGRCPVPYSSLADAVAAAKLMRDSASQLDGSLAFDGTTGLWRWSASLHTAAVAQSVYAYPRRVECLRSLRQFIDSMPAADLSPLDVRLLGHRAFRAYDPAPLPSGQPS